MDKVNLSEQFSFFSSHWDPKVVGELNGQHVKLVKFQGPFVWHRHENEDELFLVHKGRFTMEFRDRSVPVIDNTFATPVNFRPLEMGFALSIHSGTKYLNGHDDIAAGCVIGRKYVERIRHRLNRLGGSLDAHTCFLSTGG